MRRHHFLTLHTLGAATDTTTQHLDVPADWDIHRTWLPRTQEAMRRQLPRLFIDHPSGGEDTTTGEHIPRSEQTGDTDTNKIAPSPGFLGREISVTSLSSMSSYNRLMHAHTKNQMDSPGGGTIPTYAKTMHAHTLGQLNEHRRTSRSAATSPSLASRPVVLPLKGAYNGVTTLSLDEHGIVPLAPVNTPDSPFGKMEPAVGVDFGKLRRRSLTTPYAARDFAVVDARDFAAGAVGC